MGMDVRVGRQIPEQGTQTASKDRCLQGQVTPVPTFGLLQGMPKDHICRSGCCWFGGKGCMCVEGWDPPSTSTGETRGDILLSATEQGPQVSLHQKRLCHLGTVTDSSLILPHGPHRDARVTYPGEGPCFAPHILMRTGERERKTQSEASLTVS